jgi:hypothetical protein
MRRDVIRTRKRREKDLLQSQEEEPLNDQNLDMTSLELSVAEDNVKLETDMTPSSSSLSSSSTSSIESCNSYNYTEPNDCSWTPHDVNPLAYIFTESMDFYNPDHTGIS